MVWCDRCSVMVLSKKRYLCKGDGEVWKSLEIYAAKRSFRILRLREGSPWYVAWSSLYRAKHVTRLELVEGKSSK